MKRKNYRLREGSIAWYTSKLWKPVVAGVVVTSLAVSIVAFADEKEPAQVNYQEPVKSLPVSEFQAFTPIDVPLDAKLQEFIFGVAEDYGLEGELVMAVIGQESNYKHCVIGDDGNAYGLMQVHPSQHGDRMERMKVTDLLDPYENVVVGVDYLAECVDRFGVEYGLIAYNAGPDDAIDGIGGQLFMQYVRALKESGCKYFLYENNHSIHKDIKAFISEQLGVEPIMINSTLVSAQERKRCYWTNIPNIEQPQDRKVYLKDILEIETDEQSQDRILMTISDFDVKVRKHYIDQSEFSMFLKSKKQASGKTTKEIAEQCNVPETKAAHWFRTDKCFAIPEAEVWETLKGTIGITETFYDKQVTEFEIKKNSFDMAKRIYNINGKHPTLTTLSGGHQRKTITDGKDLFYLEPWHCEKLQTLPQGYTEGISDRQRFKCLGNGWTVDVIAHIFTYLKGAEKNA